jgi:5-methylcytosine-specific restriction endonuclease McrA
VFARDGSRCQYCGRAAENLDHVVPRSRGGGHVWENVVAACRPCNARKEDRFLSECGMSLRRPPVAPQLSTWFVASAGRIDPAWERYLGVEPDDPQDSEAVA